MSSSSKRGLILTSLLIVSVGPIAWISIHAVQNPMDTRYETLQSEIDEIQVKPIFYVDTSVIDFVGLDQAFKARPKLWQELIPAPKQAAAQALGPNFKHLMDGITPSRIGMRVGGKAKVRVATPEHPRGIWIQVGDMLNTAKVTQITDKYVVVEKSKGGKMYSHLIPRT